MNFRDLTELNEGHQFEELKVIGKDAVMGGKQVHLIAMVRTKTETTLYVMWKAQAEAGEDVQQEQTNRRLFKDYVKDDFALPKKLEVDGRVLRSKTAWTGCLQERDLDSLLTLAKFMEAGWSLPQSHELMETDWKQIEMMCCVLQPTSEPLPDWENADVQVTWYERLKAHYIEMPVKLVFDHEKKEASCEKELLFKVRQDDGTLKEAACYINRIRMDDLWEKEEERYNDPEYRRQMLEEMTEEEYEKMSQVSYESLMQVCPRGMYVPVIEYECTMDLNLQFYTSELLDSAPSYSETGANILFGVQTEEKVGEHGMPVKRALIQQPVGVDTKELQIELFSASEVVPRSKETLKWLN